MLLVIDIGNTSISFGVYTGEKLIESWRISTSAGKTPDEYGTEILNFFDFGKIDRKKISGSVMSCVVPPLLPVFEEVSERYFQIKPLVVGREGELGMPILYDNPKEVGADRLSVSIAAFELYKGPVIVVDFGTATTFDIVSEKGEYVGGVIAPGIGISSQALFEKGAQLPHVELAKPESVIGRNTRKSMQAGIVYGSIGQVREILSRIKREIGGNPKIVATGGYASLIAPGLDMIDTVNQDLVLEGLRIIWERSLRARK
ncbi:MAG: type III pantothenate kinase [bacterium]